MPNKSPREHVLIVPFNEFNRLSACAETCLNLLEKGEKVKIIYLQNKYHANRIKGVATKLGKDSSFPVEHLFRFLKSKGIQVEKRTAISDDSKSRIESFENTVLTEAKELKELQYEGLKIGLGIYSSLMSASNCSQPDLKKYNHLVRRFLYETALTIEHCLDISKDITFDELHIFNGRFHHCRAIVEVFRTKNISLNYYEIVAYNGFRLINQPEPIHNFSYRRELVREMWEKGPSNKHELGEIFFDHDYRLKDHSSRTYHGNQTQNLIPEKVKKVRWVYYTSSDDEYESLSDVFIHPVFESQKEGVSWLIEEAGKRDNTELIIRVHPHKAKKCKADSEWWNSLKGKNVTLIDAFSKTDTYALAKSADVVLCYNSTIGMESTYLGKPVIMLGDSFYRGMECGYEPNSVEDLYGLLQENNLSAFPKENCLSYGYYMYARGTQFRYYKPKTLSTGGFDVFYHGFWKSITHERIGQRVLRVSELLNRKKNS